MRHTQQYLHHKVKDIDDCISNSETMKLEIALSGFIILASIGKMTIFLNKLQKGFRKMYLLMMDFFRDIIYSLSSVLLTLIPFWKISTMAKSINNEIKQDLQLLNPQILMLMIDIRGRNTVSNSPISCIIFSLFLVSQRGIFLVVINCIFFPDDSYSNIYGQQSIDQYGFFLIKFSSYFYRSSYQSVVAFYSQRALIGQIGYLLGCTFSIQMPWDWAMATDFIQNLIASIRVRNSGMI